MTARMDSEGVRKTKKAIIFIRTENGRKVILTKSSNHTEGRIFMI